MSKLASCLVALAACTLLAPCAGEPVALPHAADYRPAPRSTLVSGRDPNFLIGQWQQGAELTMVLACQRAGAAPRPVARLVQVRPAQVQAQGQAQDSQVSIQWLPQSVSGAGCAEPETAALEQLYALVFQHEPQARYCLGSDGAPCDPALDGVSHAQVLHALADARERAAADRAPTVVPWRVVEMRGSPTRSLDVDVVAVRATTQHVPLEGLAVHFNRAPHSLCVARTGSDGVAVCRLEDHHGDDHANGDATPVVATFPGDVRTDRVLLPTTLVLPATDGERAHNILPGKP